MPEQHSELGLLDKTFYTYFFDTGHKLKNAGVCMFVHVCISVYS